MSTVKWATPSAQGSNIAGTALNSLGSGSTSSFITYDNSANLDLYCSVLITLASMTPVAPASITLRVFSCQSSDVPDNNASVGGGESYTAVLDTAGSAKTIVFPMVRLYPESMRFAVVNNSGASFASSGHGFKVRPYNESVA